ncbi:hypothetical protein NDU88_005024 [Pleurodeles waltl]|uniref:Uncharacterized protein n=1 Tax=Pleurodeles waltl TaxID=8319 RepID=A0AAV7WU22_PLEWA|nr:hypothetical protein NDU88_005024 [Pleurodeles waltl]
MRQQVEPNPPSRRGPATSGERATPIGSPRRRLPVTAHARRLLFFRFTGPPAGAWLGRVAAHAAHPSRWGRPKTPQQRGPGTPARAAREAPGETQGICPASPPSAQAAGSNGHRRRPRRSPAVSGVSPQDCPPRPLTLQCCSQTGGPSC